MMLSRPLMEPPTGAADEGASVADDCVQLRSVKAQQMDAEI